MVKILHPRFSFLLAIMLQVLMIKAIGDASFFNIMKKRHFNINNDLRYKHGMTKTKIYTKWRNIINRLFNPYCKQYKYYGGRCISIFPKWKHNFLLFYDYVSALPNYGVKGFTLDRINNDGDYVPENIQWVNHHLQNANRNMRKDNKSGYIGVFYNPRMKIKWQAFIKINNKKIVIGLFNTPEAAALARNQYIIFRNLVGYHLNKLN